MGVFFGCGGKTSNLREEKKCEGKPSGFSFAFNNPPQRSFANGKAHQITEGDLRLPLLFGASVHNGLD